MNFKFEEIVEEVLQEGEGLEGFDLPPRYPLSKNNIFKKIEFPGSLLRGTKNKFWYVECTPVSSNNWAINRAAAAQLRRDGVPQSEMTKQLFKFIKEHPPKVKAINSEVIPDNERNIIFLKKR